jgi:hypothetical protein
MKTLVDKGLDESKKEAWHPMACDFGDKFIRNYVRDSAAYCECWEFEDAEGKVYTVCVNQNGHEWIENE